MPEPVIHVPDGGEVPITDALIRLGACGTGGWTKKQLTILGVPWPPPKGWRAYVVGGGGTLTREAAERFLSREGKKPAVKFRQVAEITPPPVPPAVAQAVTVLPPAVTSPATRRQPCPPYEPEGLPRAAALIREARCRCCRPDGLPHDWGWQPPGETPPDCWVRLVLSALYVALEQEDWGRVAEAAGMLQDAERFLRPPAEEGDDERG